MFRTILCTLALTVALTAASAEAGKFQIKIGGGGFNHNNHNHNNHKFHFNGHNNHHHHFHKPIVQPTCYYQVCYWHPTWGYKKHKVFCHLYQAQAFAHDLQHQGIYATISKTCSPVYVPQATVPHSIGHTGVNNWLP